MGVPITGVYVNYLDSFFGNLDSQEQQDLWDKFVVLNGYSLSNPPPQTLVTQEQFLQFLKGIYDIEQTLVLSPDEVKKRDIMFRTFDILLEMLTTLQNTVGVQGKNLIFYGKWQEQYTQMLTRVPTYVGETSSKQTSPATLTVDNMDQLKFGYDNLSAKDIAEWWAYKQASGETATFNLDSEQQRVSPLTGPLYTLSITTGATPSASFSYVFTPPSPFPPLPVSINITLPTPSTNPDLTARYQENLTAFNTAFVNSWNTQIAPAYQNSTPGSTQDPTTLINVQWLHTYVTPAGSTDQNEQRRGDAESKARGEINARNQQYIENIRSLRDVVQNAAKQVESNLSQTKESISQQSDLLTSILESLKNLISAIFR